MSYECGGMPDEMTVINLVKAIFRRSEANRGEMPARWLLKRPDADLLAFDWARMQQALFPEGGGKTQQEIFQSIECGTQTMVGVPVCIWRDYDPLYAMDGFCRDVVVVSEMIERVATQLEVTFRGAHPNATYPVSTWHLLARAGIEAMREPTDPMIKAGWVHHAEDFEDERANGNTISCFQDMIEAALKLS